MANQETRLSRIRRRQVPRQNESGRKRKSDPPAQTCKWKRVNGKRTRVCKPIRTGKTKQQALRDRLGRGKK